MSDTFSEREKSFEAKQKMDEELKFKTVARRNKLLGLWAAEKMGITGADADAYAKTVVVADLEEPGDDDVLRKVVADFEERKVSASEAEIREQLEHMLQVATTEIHNEYPEALGGDHGPVGG